MADVGCRMWDEGWMELELVAASKRGPGWWGETVTFIGDCGVMDLEDSHKVVRETGKSRKRALLAGLLCVFEGSFAYYKGVVKPNVGGQ